ncbi:MAG: hypothetical protein H7Z75_08615, partial [Ferruginibacter sp.]|nr:hypothetical protein [Cytophagales bacterium]
DVNKSVFTSTDSTQEGLSFRGSSAAYDVAKFTLNIGGVPYITTADARVIPHEGKVAILETAVMRPLTKARLQIDTLNHFHNLIDGNVQVLSKSRFTGDATYQYVNVLADTFRIKFGNFESRPLEKQRKNEAPAFFTAAEGQVTEENQFFVSSSILFRGKMTMLAPERNLQLDGFIKPELRSWPDLGSWIAYQSNKTENVVINVDEKLASEGVPLFTGLHFDRGTSDLYPTFLSPKRAPDDEDAFITRGTLNYQASVRQFKINWAGKESGTSYEGNALLFDDAKGILSLEGKLNLMGSKPNDYLQAAGFGTLNFKEKTSVFNALLAFDFPLPPPALTTMAGKIIDTEAEEKLAPKEAAEDRDKLLVKMGALIGDGAVKSYKAKAELEHVPLFEASKKLSTALVLSNVDLHWSDAQKSFYSVGKIGVSNIGNVDINMQMDGFVEIRKNPNGDEAVIYLELTPDVWYLWSFRDNQLSLLSSDESFNNVISSKAKSKGKAGQYAFALLGGDEKEATLENLVKNYPVDKKPFANKKAEKPVVETTAEEPAVEESTADEATAAEETGKKERGKKPDRKPEKASATPEETPVKTEDGKTAGKGPKADKDGKNKKDKKEPVEKTASKDKKDKKKPVPAEEEEKDGF